jgi:hypothetical protein
MALYNRIWKCFAGVVVGAGLFLELITHNPSLLLALVTLSAAVAVCVNLGIKVGEGDPASPPGTPPGHVFGHAFLAALGLAALVGLATLGAVEMLGLAALVVVTSPQFLAGVGGVDAMSTASRAEPASVSARAAGARAHSERLTPPHGDIDVDSLTARDVAAMDTQELVRDWRRSYIALEAATDPQVKMALVKLRQAYLDELERRHPDGLHDWLESGARAAGDPTKFVARDREQDTGGSQAA